MVSKRSTFEKLIAALPGRFDDFLRALEPHMYRLEAWSERLKARIEAARIEREKAWEAAEAEYQRSEMRRKRHLRSVPSGDDDIQDEVSDEPA